jgi:uroporphyrin-III C-methyltransferase/precorrin-2 dehydrogenase/sirohydrochlorin ferrochelatase
VDYLPLFLRLSGERVVVVGAGAIAARKVALLRRAGAAVHVVALHAGAEIAAQAERGELTLTLAPFRGPHLRGARLVIAATDDRHVNAEVARAARRRRIAVNVVDDAALSDAIVPAIVDRSPLLVAIGSGGQAPALASEVRSRLEAWLEPSLGRLAALLGRFKQRLRARFADAGARRRFVNELARGPVAHALSNGHELAAEALLRAALREATPAAARGRVLLVGAGPGDPGLLTLRALRALHDADVVLYDRLVSPEVLALGRRDAEYVAVGKRHGEADATQARILELMRAHARAGRTVVRLKGGDPLLFARAEEELAALRADGIAFEIVPGISAAFAAAAYAGIPLTARDGADGVQLVTAAHCAGRAAPDWSALARSGQTLVFYMGIATLPAIAAGLQAHGRAPDTPVALVERASLPDQRVLIATLATVAAAARAHAIAAPALAIVGAQAARAAELHWFGAAPIDDRYDRDQVVRAA